MTRRSRRSIRCFARRTDADLSVCRTIGDCDETQRVGDLRGLWDAAAVAAAEEERSPVKKPTIEGLEKRRAVVIADLLAKVDAEDWHGVADAAMDLREIDAQLAVMT